MTTQEPPRHHAPTSHKKIGSGKIDGIGLSLIRIIHGGMEAWFIRESSPSDYPIIRWCRIEKVLDSPIDVAKALVGEGFAINDVAAFAKRLVELVNRIRSSH